MFALPDSHFVTKSTFFVLIYTFNKSMHIYYNCYNVLREQEYKHNNFLPKAYEGYK